MDNQILTPSEGGHDLHDFNDQSEAENSVRERVTCLYPKVESEDFTSTNVGRGEKTIEEATSDTSEEDYDARLKCKRGSGNLGFGSPLKVKSAGKTRAFHDGGGPLLPRVVATGKKAMGRIRFIL